MDRDELQRYIEENIPVVRDMGFVIRKIEEGVVVIGGEYCRHINHTKSVFGGSISSVMTLACWGRVRLLIEEFAPEGTVVIKNGSTDFLHPVTEDYEVSTLMLSEEGIRRLRRSYRRFGRGRIAVEAVLTHRDSNRELARFRGEFVVLS